MLAKQCAMFTHRVHSTSNDVDYLAFNIGPGTQVKFKLEILVQNYIFT